MITGRLSVVYTSPTPKDINVDTSSKIYITFDADVSKRTLAGNIIILDGKGKQIDCYISSANRDVTITPRNPLPDNSSITVIIKGCNDPNNALAPKGVLSPTGDCMLGDYSFSFSTISKIKETESVVNMAPDNVALTRQPIFKGDITHNTINVPQFIDIEISSSNTFETNTMITSFRCSVEDFIIGVKADRNIPYGSYYWKARTVCKVNGDWCGPCGFAIDDHSTAKVVAEDHIAIDPAFPIDWNLLEAKVEDTFPNDKRTNVKNNLKTISIVIDQIIPEEELQYASLKIVGTSLNSDEEEEIDPTVSIVYDHENSKTIIIAELPEIIDEEDIEEEIKEDNSKDEEIEKLKKELEEYKNKLNGVIIHG